MSDTAYSLPPTAAQLQALLTTQAPPAEAVAALAGSGATAARNDHVHPRLTSVTVQSTDASGNATITFSRVFPAKPGVVLTAYESNPQPVVFQVVSFQQDVGLNYTGCVVKAYRSQPVPQNLVALLVGAVYNLFGAAVGATPFSCVAIMPSA